MAVSKHGVSIHLDTKRKLVFRHKDLRDMSVASGQSVGDNFSDPFGGWAYLLQFGLRTQDPRVSLDKASDFMDLWVDQPDPETKQPRTLDQLGEVLLEALNASGFVKIEKFAAPSEQAKLPEGNE